MMDIDTIRKDFPMVSRTQNGKPFVYLDSAATSQKPESVLVEMDHVMRTMNANVHRGIYQISELATEAYEGARDRIAHFIGADTEEIIFTRNATESINLIALTWARQNLKEGDEILITEMEHHSNIIPWQMLAKERKIILSYVPINVDEGILDIKEYEKLLQNKPKLVCIGHMSNLLGTVHPVKEMTNQAHDAGAVVLVDGCQAVPHMPVNVHDLGVDFYAFSGHKMVGPTGIGVLYGKKKLLEQIEPIIGGGDMIKTVTKNGATWNDIPWKFEAGTPNIIGVIGLGAAVEYLSKIGMKNIWKHELSMSEYIIPKLQTIDGVKLFGMQKPSEQRGAIFSFWIDGMHPHDIASIFDEESIAIRAGHMCAQLALERYERPAVARASFYLYNTEEEADVFLHTIGIAKKIFAI